MAETKKTGEPGDVVELADKEGGFTDPETGFDISRKQRLELGDTVGERTQQAIRAGGLVVVKGGKKSKAADSDDGDGPSDDYDLPADLPGRDAFIAAGYTEFARVKELDTEEKLLEVKGIGPGTVKGLKAWAKDHPEE